MAIMEVTPLVVPDTNPAEKEDAIDLIPSKVKDRPQAKKRYTHVAEKLHT
jgi:hypothetical protein